MLRLQRTGRNSIPTYRVVVAEKKWPVKGRFIEILGYYLQDRNPSVWEIKEERVRHWLQHGAVPSGTVARLLVKGGVQEAQKYVKKYVHRRKRKGGDEEAAPAGDAPAS